VAWRNDKSDHSLSNWFLERASQEIRREKRGDEERKEEEKKEEERVS
jgi:hypothetical protein